MRTDFKLKIFAICSQASQLRDLDSSFKLVCEVPSAPRGPCRRDSTILMCSWLGEPSAVVEAMKGGSSSGDGEGAGLSLLSVVSICLGGFWRLACSLLPALRAPCVTSRGRSQLPWEVLAPASGGPSTWDMSEATACRSVGSRWRTPC